MTYAEAKKALRKQGVAHASGDTLRAMYAELLPVHACLSTGRGKKAVRIAERIYTCLQKQEDDTKVREKFLFFMRNPLKIWDEIPDILD